MNQCQRAQPSAVGLPDFIQNAAKHVHILVHTCMHRADAIPGSCFVFCSPSPPTSASYLSAHVLASAAFSAMKRMH